MADIKPDLIDPQSSDNQKLANLLDPANIATFIKMVQDTNEKRSLEELFEAWLEGKI